ncbi:MAG TPA: patatin family protein, partial [Flavobacteriales bacterium]|nr:patatin family protein [Flavobacteriales bacterium]
FHFSLFTFHFSLFTFHFSPFTVHRSPFTVHRSPKMKHALVIQGGGFRTAFSSGVLDAFLEEEYFPFDIIAAVSGGAIAASYFIAQQKEHCFRSICFLSEKGRFVNINRALRAGPLMDIDIFHAISNKHFPFDKTLATERLIGKKFAIVMTNRANGQPHYCDPTTTNWEEAVIASCSLPFITKGKQHLNGNDYIDGAWGDPLPVEWAAEQGATTITVVRTSPPFERQNKSWFDRIGELYYLKNPSLRNAFSENHLRFNRSIDFIENPPDGIAIHQIAPDFALKAGLYTQSKEHLEDDYRYGFALGKQYCTMQQTVISE